MSKKAMSLFPINSPDSVTGPYGNNKQFQLVVVKWALYQKINACSKQRWAIPIPESIHHTNF